MATNKLLPFANGVGANVTDYDTWSALTTLLSQGFTTGVARSDYANRVFAQGALASYILGQFVVDQTAQDADLNETTFYINFKNALINYIKANAVSLDTAQTVGGVKTFTSIPLVPTADAADNSQKVANTAFVQGEIASKANASEVVKLTGNQTIAGTKTFSDSPEVPNNAFGNSSLNSANTAFVKVHVDAVAPVGSYIYFAGQSVPDHYLLCNGSAVSRTDYADLYAVIGDTYGSGDGSTTFNLPNLIDKFLEGSGTIGTVKNAGLPNITGRFWYNQGHTNGFRRRLAAYGNGAFTPAEDNFQIPDLKMESYTEPGNGYIDFSAASSNATYGGSNTVQPPALTALPCIRYE